MKKIGRNALITIGLLLVLVAVIGIEIILFISGPALRYEDQVASQEQKIQEQYTGIESLNRHVFSYVIYCGDDGKDMYWFNENGELMLRRELNQLDTAKAAQKGLEEYGLNNSSVTIGYGYKNPVYIVSNDQGELLLDIDTMKEVFYRKKG